MYIPPKYILSNIQCNFLYIYFLPNFSGYIWDFLLFFGFSRFFFILSLIFVAKFYSYYCFLWEWFFTSPLYILIAVCNLYQLCLKASTYLLFAMLFWYFVQVSVFTPQTFSAPIFNFWNVITERGCCLSQLIIAFFLWILWCFADFHSVLVCSKTI